MSEKEENDLFYVCSLIEHIGRKTKNRRGSVVAAMDDRCLMHQFEYADMNHSLPFDRVSDELIADAGLDGKTFPEMSDEWLDFIADCRAGKDHGWDIVEGPMANDTVWNYVNDFVSGAISREAFWALAKFKHPTHQICFHTPAALRSIKFLKAEELPRK